MGLRFRNKVMVTPDDVRMGDAFAIKVVAWVHGDGSWAAYLGPSDWEDERVVYEGDVIAQEVAEGLFYVLANSGRPYGEL